MTLLELRYLITLAEQKHFGRAAELCHVSQPTLSMAIRKLEENLGVLLFERSKSGIQATTMGQQIIAQAQRVISQADTITALAAADKDQLSGDLRLGAIFTLGPYLLPQLIPQLRLSAPSLQLHLFESFTIELRQKLRGGELDAILVSLPFSEPDVVTQELFEEPLLVIMPPNHVLAAKNKIALDDIVAQPLVLLANGHCLRNQVLDLFSNVGSAPQKILESSSLETLRHMVAAGLGVSMLPSSAISSSLYASNVFVARPLQQSPRRKLALAWRASYPRHKAIDALRRAIQTCCWRFTTAHENSGSGLLVENNNW